MALPSVIQEKMKSWFGYPHEQTYAQVATTSGSRPHIRTMFLFEITKEGHPIFLTHRLTQKWQDLEISPYVAAVFVNYNFGQVTVEGDAELKTRNHPEIAHYWQHLHKNYRQVYAPPIQEEIPETFGVIIVKPQSWEMLELDRVNISQSIRRRYIFVDNAWISEDLMPY